MGRLVSAAVDGPSHDAAPILMRRSFDGEGGVEEVMAGRTQRPDKEPLEFWRLCLLTVAMGGVTLGYGLQVGTGTAMMKR